MPYRNRALPDQSIVVHPARGTMMGNRGRLHDADGRITRHWTTRAWIACRLSFKGRRRTLMRPGHHTELFFLDEAVAAAAGHRPCAECRRTDYRAFRALWETVHGPVHGVAGIDAVLHAARIDLATRRQLRHRDAWVRLPEGAFALLDGLPHLVLADRLLPFVPDGYGAPRPRPRAGATLVVTPAPLVELMRAGWAPGLHPTVRESCTSG